MLVKEYLEMAKDLGIHDALVMLANDLQYLEVNYDNFFKEMWKEHKGEELVIPEEKVSEIKWYYEIYNDQTKLATEGAKPIDFKPINNLRDIKRFLKDMYNLSEDDVIDQWGVHPNF